MTRYSLRLRLLAGAAVAIFVALAIAGAAMTVLFQRQILQRVEQELRRDALQLVAGLSVDAAGAIMVLQVRPIRASIRRRAASIGRSAASRRPSVRVRSGTRRSRLPPAADALQWRTRFGDGPDGHRLFLLERFVQPAGSQDRVLVQLGLDEQELHAARAEFGTMTALFLLVLWAVLAGAAWIQVQLGLRPLAHLRRELAALRHNAAERLSADYPREVEPLTRAINDLASASRGRRQARPPTRRRSRAWHEDTPRRPRRAEPPHP